MEMKDIKSVCVLMSTYNGNKYIQEQMNSLLLQKGVNITILIRDDGSWDETQNIIENYAINHENISWYQGDNLGPAKSFMNLVINSPSADYYAFCDQDDKWYEDKLFRAVKMLEETEQSIPALYYSNVYVTDDKLNIVKKSNNQIEYNNLKHILLHNNMIGCTAVFNDSLKKLLKRYNPNYINMHDWWTYVVCLSCGGRIVFDSNAYTLYRQHENNAIGYKTSHKKLKTIIFEPGECRASKQAKELLTGYKNYITKDNLDIVKIVAEYSISLKKRFCLLTDNSFYRETGISRLREKIAVIRKRK